FSLPVTMPMSAARATWVDTTMRARQSTTLNRRLIPIGVSSKLQQHAIATAGSPTWIGFSKEKLRAVESSKPHACVVLACLVRRGGAGRRGCATECCKQEASCTEEGPLR